MLPLLLTLDDLAERKVSGLVAKPKAQAFIRVDVTRQQW